MAEEFVGYVTDHALTRGIERKMLRLRVRTNGRLVAEALVDGTQYDAEGEDWHRTWESALAAAEQMRAGEIAYRRRELARLESLTFEEPK